MNDVRESPSSKSSLEVSASASSEQILPPSGIANTTAVILLCDTCATAGIVKSFVPRSVLSTPQPAHALDEKAQGDEHAGLAGDKIWGSAGFAPGVTLLMDGNTCDELVEGI